MCLKLVVLLLAPPVNFSNDIVEEAQKALLVRGQPTAVLRSLIGHNDPAAIACVSSLLYAEKPLILPIFI